jgi:hypothetical protein
LVEHRARFVGGSDELTRLCEFGYQPNLVMRREAMRRQLNNNRASKLASTQPLDERFEG